METSIVPRLSLNWNRKNSKTILYTCTDNVCTNGGVGCYNISNGGRLVLVMVFSVVYSRVLFVSSSPSSPDDPDGHHWTLRLETTANGYSNHSLVPLYYIGLQTATPDQ